MKAEKIIDKYFGHPSNMNAYLVDYLAKKVFDPHHTTIEKEMVNKKHFEVWYDDKTDTISVVTRFGKSTFKWSELRNDLINKQKKYKP